MANIPTRFPEQAERAVASYNWTDIASGSGFVAFDLFTAAHDDNKDNTIELKHLVSENAMYSAKTDWSEDGNTDENRTYETLTFNLPRIIQGYAFVMFSQGTVSNDSVSNSITWVTVTIQKEDTDGATTNLGSATAEKVLSSDNSNPQLMLHALRIDLTETNVKKGEKIKVKLEMTKDGATSNNKTAIYTDPSNISRTFGSETTDLSRFIVNIPFKIDL